MQNDQDVDHNEYRNDSRPETRQVSSVGEAVAEGLLLCWDGSYSHSSFSIQGAVSDKERWTGQLVVGVESKLQLHARHDGDWARWGLSVLKEKSFYSLGIAVDEDINFEVAAVLPQNQQLIDIRLERAARHFPNQVVEVKSTGHLNIVAYSESQVRLRGSPTSHHISEFKGLFFDIVALR